jgi:acyl transferase domain-containing protein/NAD(P)H-dependent flavin oxidoreductase YrpB (nitropropane dioxygenase family)
MLAKSTLHDLVIAISPCGGLEPSPGIAAEAWRGGGLGVLDLAVGGWPQLQALAQAVSWSAAPIGVRVQAGCVASAADVRHYGAGQVALTVLAAGAPWDVAEAASWSRVLIEVTSREEAVAAAASGAAGLIARGMESGGTVGNLSTFVLLQQLLADDAITLPVWAAGGIGLRTAAACVAGGAAGVVLDSQLGLMPESDLPGDVMRVLRRLDGSETVMVAGQRGIRVTGRPLRLAGPRDTETTLLPIGQDGWLAAPFAARWRDTAAAVRGVRAAIVDVAWDGAGHQVLAPDAPLAKDLGVRVPVAQGPMTRVSDQAGFAAAVAADGGLPFIALALADGARSRQLLQEAATALDGRPWGVGVLGFAPEELRAAQLEAILDIRPSCAIVAGGRPAQAKQLEQVGIATFLHVPSPTLLRQFLGSGARRFVFEGAECGGHIGPRASFALWETQLAVIDEFLDGASPGTAADLQVLFAGGIHDARSAAMVAALAAPLARRDVRVGVLMGTAYLFTREAVEHRAIKPLFQRMAMEASETALLETAPGHVTRALRTAYVEEFARQRTELEEGGKESRDTWMHLELLNTGRLRLATKGLEHDGTELDEAAQAREGLYMAGQVAVLRTAVTTVAALHAEVTAGAVEFADQRMDALQELLAGQANDAAAADEGDEADAPVDIAVVGMAGMFAGSPDMETFWRLVLSGKDAFREVPAERWDPSIYFTPESADCQSGRHTVSKWGGFLEPVAIDPIRYGITPASLGSIDPSQLLALEVADQALSDAGYPYNASGTAHSRTGVVFAAEPGSDSGSALAVRALLPAYLGEIPPELDEQLPTFTEDTFPGNLPNVVAGRIANRLNLGGINLTVDAACAASLAAVDVACKQLITGAADLMLCGAVDLHNSISDFLMFGSVHALSPTGRVATFDSAADGTALGEGVACVALKRLADARRDGDRIYVVIKGVGAASDGRARSLTAPHVAGQVSAMRRAYRQAGLSPSEVGLVEAHGTGTVLGDQTELESLTEVFTAAGAGPGSCVLGSVKSQIGHAKCAAGLAGLIKVALGIYYGIQPPTSNLTSPNQAWDAERSPFAFLAGPRPWVAPPDRRIAGLSAFGFGGTNFHIVLSGHAETAQPRHALDAWPAELFCFRGANRDAAHEVVRRLAGTLAVAAARPGGVRLRDLAARAARDAETASGPVRVAVVASDASDLATLLRRALAGEHDPAAGLIQPPSADPAERPAVALLFPGQGSQRTGALADLFVAFPELRYYLRIGQRWAGKLFPPAAFDLETERQQTDLLRDTATAQPALGICGLAVSHLLGRLGVRADMSGGHSYGELVALSTAGAFAPETLLDLSEVRAAAILAAAGEDPGTMAAVSGTAEQAAAVLDSQGLTGEVALANLNSPSQVVISGPVAGVDSALAALRAAGLAVRRLRVACAFHSPVVAAASARFAEELSARQVSAPRLPVWSNRTAEPYPDDPALIRAEMAAQISAPVRFGDQIEAMYAAGARVFIEAGPGQALTGLVHAVLADRPHVAVACDAPAGQGLRKFLITLAEIVCAGVPLDLSWLFQGRDAADPADPATVGNDGRPRWTANGQLIRDGGGAYPAGGITPARLIREFPMSQSDTFSARPTDPSSALAEYLRVSGELVAAQRDVMLTFLAGQPAGRLVWQPESAGMLAEHVAPRPAVPAAVELPAAATLPAADTVSADAVPAAAGSGPLMPTSGPALQDALIALISERTGYPVDLIDPGLDLEADLGIDSIKRAEVASAVASRLNMSVDTDDSVVEGLVKARSVRGIVDWLQQMMGDGDKAQAGGQAPAPGPADAAPDPEAAADTRPEADEGIGEGSDVLAGVAWYWRPLPAPARLVPQRAQADLSGQPSGSAAGTGFLVTGETEVAGELAGKLRELGAQVRVTSLDALTRQEVRDADGLIFLDGLAEGAGALPPALFPHIKNAVTGQDETAAGRRWLLAAGAPGNSGATGLAGLFRTIALEYPDGFARYVELDGAAPVGDIASCLLAELLTDGRESAVSYDGATRYRLQLAQADLGAEADDNTAAAQALGLTNDSVVVLIGGGRGITASLATELAALSKCRIELIGRTELAAESLPEDVNAATDAVALRAALARAGMRVPAEIERATRDILARREISATVAELRELGAQVRYHCADALDEEAINQIFKQVHEEHRRIDGVVYAAGVIDDRLIYDKDPESYTRVFDTKVSGARAVLSAITEHQCAPAWVVLYGSVAAYGSRGQSDYSAANDALATVGAAWAAATGHRCLTVQWGPWAPAGEHPGMVRPELGRQYARRGYAMIDAKLGVHSLLSELAWGDPALTAVSYTGMVPDVG